MVTLTEVPVERRSPGWRKWWPRIVIGLLVFAALMGPMAASRVANLEIPEPPAPDAEYRLAATEIAQAFLDGRETGACVGESADDAVGRVALSGAVADEVGVDIDQETPGALDVASLTWVSFSRGDIGDQQVETHQFSVVTDTDQAFALEVPVADTDDGACLAGGLALVPAPRPSSDTAESIDWSEVLPDNTAQLSDGGEDQVQVWAQAWSAGDERALYTLTGDTRNVRYRGLGGFALGGEAVVTSTITTDPADPSADQIVTVVVTLVSAENPEFATTATYDLLVSNPDQPLPFIVAWGPAGSGLDLEPLGNAEDPVVADTVSTTTVATDSTSTVPADSDQTTTTGAQP